MAPVKPLHELLSQADALTKVASAESRDVGSTGAVHELADLLSSATSSVELAAGEPAVDQAEFEKAAEAFNRTQVASAIDCAVKFELFEKRAKDEGYTQEQIEDAFLKVASEKVVKNLPLMMATVGMIGGMGPSAKNALPKKPSLKAYTRMLGDRDLTRSTGY